MSHSTIFLYSLRCGLLKALLRQGLASTRGWESRKSIWEILMRKPFSVSAAVFLLLLISPNLTAVAQSTSPVTAAEIRSSVKNDTSQTLQSLKSSLSKIRRPLERRVYPPPQINPKRLSPKFRQSKIDSALQLNGGPVVPITMIASVDGLGRDLPDSNDDCLERVPEMLFH